MLEIEVKYPLPDFGPVRLRLNTWGAEALGERVDVDRYFNAPDRDFRQTGEAFRLRRIGEQNRLTYKGPRIEHETKTRPEIEIPIAPGDAAAADMERLLQSLGYRASGTVRKRREVFAVGRGGFDLEVCLDEVDGVGRFAEVEIVAPPERFEAARVVLLETAAALGLSGPPEQRSYLEMALAAGKG